MLRRTAVLAAVDRNFVRSLITQGHSKPFFILDCRTPEEYQPPRIIPKSVNIPLHLIPTALRLTPEEFEDALGVPKPSPDDLVVTLCEHGVRATDAAYLLERAGYKDVEVYKGSCSEWFSPEHAHEHAPTSAQ
eukprot:TRINITY_DN60571_c0_g1_i1.p1 TRINITY_DN60571_c0_g1~~TRINITY_DN60571_c0_g1_i1.p1  ORF type:complete len:133 (+),score=8.18 TRINITY_DN60571_c0_g1_i1:103-501(+)